MEVATKKTDAGSAAKAVSFFSSQQPSQVQDTTPVTKPQISALPPGTLPSHGQTLSVSQAGQPSTAPSQTNGVPIQNGAISATSTPVVGHPKLVHQLVGPVGVTLPSSTQINGIPNHSSPQVGRHQTVVPQVGLPSTCSTLTNGIPNNHTVLSGNPQVGLHQTAVPHVGLPSNPGAALTSMSQAAALAGRYQGPHLGNLLA